MFKKAFTLFELMIVIVIIGMLLSVVSLINNSYIRKLKIDEDNQVIINSFEIARASILGEYRFGNKLLKQIGIKILPGGNSIYLLGKTTGEVFNLNAYRLGFMKFGSGFLFDNKFFSTGFILWYDAYNIRGVLNFDNKIFTGNKSIIFWINRSGGAEKQCFKVNLDGGRVYSISCKAN